MKVKVRLDNYTGNAGFDATFNVIVVSAICNCSLLTWDPPTVVTSTIDVSNVSNPRTVTAPFGTVNAASKIATPAIRSCTSGSVLSCPVTSTLTATMKGGAVLPSAWMSFNGTIFTLNPTTASHIGTWTFTITQTVATGSGANITYDGVVVTTGCILSAMPSPAAPTTGLTAELYTLKEISLLNTVYTQQPPCAYTVSNSFAWTIPTGAPITVAANPQIITVNTSLKEKVGTYTVRLTNTVTDNNQGGPHTFTPYQEFVVTVIDPCDTTVITPPLTASSIITVVNGQSASLSFAEAKDSIQETNKIYTLCGPRAYSIM